MASIQLIKAAEAEAEAIRKAGEAEAAVIRAKGLAEAERMRKKAEAWKHYSDAAYLEMLINSLPEVRRGVLAVTAAPTRAKVLSPPRRSCGVRTAAYGRDRPPAAQHGQDRRGRQLGRGRHHR